MRKVSFKYRRNMGGRFSRFGLKHTLAGDIGKRNLRIGQDRRAQEKTLGQEVPVGESLRCLVQLWLDLTKGS
jgi:hypothetical protein